MVACGRNSTSHNHCAIDRSICVRWHGVHQFLARRNIHGTFKQTGSRYSSRQLCHYVMAGALCHSASRSRPPRWILLFLFIPLAPANRRPVCLNFPPPPPPSLNPPTGPLLLNPPRCAEGG